MVNLDDNEIFLAAVGGPPPLSRPPVIENRRPPPSSAAEHACDRFAAFPADPARVTPGVSYMRIDVARAIPACRTATETFPSVGRFWFQLGRALERAADLPAAVDAYDRARRLGHLGGATNLGELYRQGKGVQRNYNQALTLFTAAANENYADAQYNIGMMKRDGLGGAQDLAAAKEWFRRAAAQGHSDAADALARLPSR